MVTILCPGGYYWS